MYEMESAVKSGMGKDLLKKFLKISEIFKEFFTLGKNFWTLKSR